MAKGVLRHGTTLALLVLVLAAGGYLLFFEDRHITTDEAVIRKDNLVPAWRADDITTLTLTRGASAVRIERGEADDAGLRLFRWLGPEGEFPASEQDVDDFLGRLEFARSLRRVSDDAVDRDSFGLTSPRLTIDIAMGGLRHTIRLGGAAPSPAGAVYAEVVDNGVFVITKELSTALDIDPSTLRSRTFVPFASTEVHALRVTTPDRTLELVRMPNGGPHAFRFQTGTPDHPTLGPIAGTRVNAASMELWLANLGALSLVQFLTDAQADSAAKSALTITLVPKTEGAKEGVLQLGGTCPTKADDVVAIRSAPSRLSGCVGGGLVEDLSVNLDDWIDDKLFGARLDEVSEITLVQGKNRLDIARAGTAWKERSPSEKDLDAEIGDALVRAVLGVHIEKLVRGERKAMGLDPPRATVRAVSIGPDGHAERAEVVNIGDDTEGGFFVERAEDGALAVVPKSASDVLRPKEPEAP